MLCTLRITNSQTVPRLVFLQFWLLCDQKSLPEASAKPIKNEQITATSWGPPMVLGLVCGARGGSASIPWRSYGTSECCRTL